MAARSVTRTCETCTYYIHKSKFNQYDKHTTDTGSLEDVLNTEKTQKAYETFRDKLAENLHVRFPNLKPADKRKGYRGRILLENNYFQVAVDDNKETIAVQLIPLRTQHVVYQHRMKISISNYMQYLLCTEFQHIEIPTGQYTTETITLNDAERMEQERRNNLRKANLQKHKNKTKSERT